MTVENPTSASFVGFPMPSDGAALLDRSRRPIVRTPLSEPRFPFPVPNGWFVVEESRELLPGESKALHVFGADVVLFRGEDGAPHMVEAYCAHLGAHIGVGGASKAAASDARSTDGSTTARRDAAWRSLTETPDAFPARRASGRSRASSATT